MKNKLTPEQREQLRDDFAVGVALAILILLAPFATFLGG